METWILSCCTPIRSIVTNLPMRNGNVLTGLKDHDRSELQIFLWGMETHIQGTAADIRCALQIFLWGMETKTVKKKAYELYGLQIFLWGMETEITRLLYIQAHLLQIFLWGMETCIDWIPNAHRSLVTNLPMRNGNAYRLSRCIRSANVTNLPMRNGNKNVGSAGGPSKFGLQIFLWGMETILP